MGMRTLEKTLDEDAGWGITLDVDAGRLGAHHGPTHALFGCLVRLVFGY